MDSPLLPLYDPFFINSSAKDPDQDSQLSSDSQFFHASTFNQDTQSDDQDSSSQHPFLQAIIIIIIILTLPTLAISYIRLFSSSAGVPAIYHATATEPPLRNVEYNPDILPTLTHEHENEHEDNSTTELRRRGPPLPRVINVPNTRYTLSPSCSALNLFQHYAQLQSAASLVLTLLPASGVWSPHHHSLNLPQIFDYYFPTSPSTILEVRRAFHFLSSPSSFPLAGPGYIFCSETDPPLLLLPLERRSICDQYISRRGAYSGNYDERHARSGLFGHVIVICDGTREDERTWVAMHELAHNSFRGFMDIRDENVEIEGWRLPAYGRALVGALRRQRPERAVRNADSYAMFAKEVWEMMNGRTEK